MIKKVFLLSALILLIFAFRASSQTNSTLNFDLEIKESDIPTGAATATSTAGNAGAIVGISLGATAGAAAIGFGADQFLRGMSGLTRGSITGAAVPISSVYASSLNISSVLQLPNVYPNLIKAINTSNIAQLPEQRIILIGDSIIQPNSYNTVFFKLPDGAKNTKISIIQACDVFGMNNLDSKLLFMGQEIPLTNEGYNYDLGVVTKSAILENIPVQNNIATLITTSTQKTFSLNYAYIIKML